MMTLPEFLSRKAASSAEPILTGFCSAPAAGPAVSPPKPPEDHRHERAVHALAHDVGEDRAGGADQRAGDDQCDVAQREADARRRPARVGVEHRDDDRHVGAADRHDDEHAESQRRRGDGPEQQRRAARLAEPVDQQHQQHRQRQIDEMARRENDRLARHAPRQLGEGDHRAGEGDGTDGDAERHLDQARRPLCCRACRYGRPPGRRARPPPRTPPPGRPESGTPPPAPASTSSGCAGRCRRRCRHRPPSRR